MKMLSRKAVASPASSRDRNAVQRHRVNDCGQISGFVEVDQSKQSERTVGILHQAAIAHLGKSIDALQRTKRVFGLGSHL